jgi:hypothetical protein
MAGEARTAAPACVGVRSGHGMRICLRGQQEHAKWQGPGMWWCMLLPVPMPQYQNSITAHGLYHAPHHRQVPPHPPPPPHPTQALPLCQPSPLGPDTAPTQASYSHSLSARLSSSALSPLPQKVT